MAIDGSDAAGAIDPLTADVLRVEVSGAGSLAALGSGTLVTTCSYADAVHCTDRGRALAVVRADAVGGGEVTVRVASERHGEASVAIQVVPQR